MFHIASVSLIMISFLFQDILNMRVEGALRFIYWDVWSFILGVFLVTLLLAELVILKEHVTYLHLLGLQELLLLLLMRWELTLDVIILLLCAQCRLWPLCLDSSCGGMGSWCTWYSVRRVLVRNNLRVLKVAMSRGLWRVIEEVVLLKIILDVIDEHSTNYL